MTKKITSKLEKLKKELIVLQLEAIHGASKKHFIRAEILVVPYQLSEECSNNLISVAQRTVMDLNSIMSSRWLQFFRNTRTKKFFEIVDCFIKAIDLEIHTQDKIDELSSELETIDSIISENGESTDKLEWLTQVLHKNANEISRFLVENF